MLLLLAYLARRFSHGCISFLVAFSLIWSPVFQARAMIPAVALVPMAVAASRVFMAAATRVGPALTHTNIGIGVGIGSLSYLVDKNWEDVVSYTANASAGYHAAVTSGVVSFAALASSVNISRIDTELASLSWAITGGNVILSYGNVPFKDVLMAFPGDTSFPYIPRNDGMFLYQPLPGHSFSSVYNTSGFKTYLCPIMNAPSNDPVTQACTGLPEIPFGEFNYGVQYKSIGTGCNDPLDCAKAYIAARLVELSWLHGNTVRVDGLRDYAYAIQNVSVNFGGCYDSRSSSYTSFPGYRCPVTLDYEKKVLDQANPSIFLPIQETYNIDVNLLKPAFSQAQTIDEYIERYPPAANLPLTPASVASIINAMFARAANVPGYEGLNYFPITAADVTQALGNAAVPLSSLVTAVAVVPGTGTGVGNPPVPGVTSIDLGPNPGIPPPTLEGIPTAAQIMAPIFDLFPSLRNFQTPGHTSQCPAFAVPFFGETISTTKHCELLESQRLPLGAAALAGWSIAVLIIVLGA